MKLAIIKSRPFIFAVLSAIIFFLGCTSYNIPNQTSGPIPSEVVKGDPNHQGPEEPTKAALLDNDKLATGSESRTVKFNEKPSILEKPLISPSINDNTSRATSLGITLNNKVAQHLLEFHLNQRRLFAKWLEHSGRYLPLMKDILREHGLPEDLVYVAMIESGLDTRALSPANASGPWQFVRGTGLKYGLKINSWIDERRDPLKSTEAAAKYFRDLYTLFGCWVLAVASYNAGEGTVLSAIERADSWDYWTLAKNNQLPAETREFVPKFMAATIIGKEYEEFGFKDLNFLPPLRLEYLKVKGGTPLKLVAKCSGASYEEIKRLNPELNKGITPPNLRTYRLKIPYGLKNTFLRNWNKWNDRLPIVEDGDALYHRVKKGDTLWGLGRRYKVSLKELQRLNRLKGSSYLKLDQILLIPKKQET